MQVSKGVKTFIYGVELVLCFVLSGIPGILPKFFSEMPILAISCALSVSAFEEPVYSVIFGAVCGAVCDVSAGSVIGPGAIACVLMCFVISYIFDAKLNVNIVYFGILALFGVAFIVCSLFLFNYVIFGFGEYEYYFVYRVLPRIAYTYFFTVILYFINKPKKD